MESDPFLENLMKQLGDFGSYQLRQHLLHILPSFVSAVHMVSLTFVASTPLHRCKLESDNVTSGENIYFTNDSHTPKSNDGTLVACRKYFRSDSENSSVGCEGEHVYDLTYIKASKVIEWNLVCEDQWKLVFLQCMFYFGILNGSIIIGSMADKFGRKVVLCISAVMQLVLGTLSSFITNYYVYCIILLFYGAFGIAGTYIPGFILTMELIGSTKRALCAATYTAAFSLGIIAASLWAFFIPNVEILQMIYGLHSLLLLAHYWLIDESIRWLWGKGRVAEAVSIAKIAVETNGRHLINNYQSPERPHPAGPEINLKDVSKTKSSLMDICRAANLRCRTLIIAYNWLANGLIYHGLWSTSASLPGNPFFISMLNGLFELPGCLIVVNLAERGGRRALSSMSLFLAALAALLLPFFPKGFILAAMTMSAKILIATSFTSIQLFSAELFPTVARCGAVGVFFMAARLAGMISAPIVLLDTYTESFALAIFSPVAILAALSILVLPETWNRDMPQSFEDGENLGVGDTGFREIKRAWQRHRDVATSIRLQ